VRALSVPLLGGVRGGFLVPMHTQDESRRSMNGPLSLPSPPPKAGERVAEGRERGLQLIVLIHAQKRKEAFHDRSKI